MSIADLRQEYAKHELDASHVADDPITQFRDWFDEVQAADIHEPNAMTLATAASNGQPSARIVLLKGLDERGFHFYTNYESQKGTEITHNPKVSLVFLWKPLERQVRIQGVAERLPDDESTEYFHSRPRGSQLGAWASPQSRVIDGRATLHENKKAVEATYADADVIPRPPHWGGYVVRPERVEFWQGRPNRLHDRLCYRKDGDAWRLERLAP